MERLTDPSKLGSKIPALEEKLHGTSPEYASLYIAKCQALATYMVPPKPFRVSPRDPA